MVAAFKADLRFLPDVFEHCDSQNIAFGDNTV